MIARVVSAENDLQALQKKYAAESVALGKIMGIVDRPEETPAEGSGSVGDSKVLAVRDSAAMPADELVSRPLFDRKLDVGSSPPPRARRSDEPAEGEDDPSLTARYDSHDHEHVDDRLVMKLLDELQDLVGPYFGPTSTTTRDASCDAIGMILAHALGDRYRFPFMHHMFPMDFPDYKSNEFIGEKTVSQYISRYLKDSWHVHVPKKNSDSIADYVSDEWLTGSGVTKAQETQRHPVKSGADTERGRSRSDELAEITRSVDKERKSNLSTPIANLLTDLRTMHDDM